MKKFILLLLVLHVALFARDIENEKNLDLDSLTNQESIDSMNSWLDGDFGLKPDKVSYLLPFGYTGHKYKSYNLDGYNNYEAELQVSLKLGVGKNIFGLKERYYLSYTHHAFWQIYTNSSPFRENNYNPEAFTIIPIFSDIQGFTLRNVKVSLAHVSNGKGKTSLTHDSFGNAVVVNTSRSMNYTYVDFAFQKESFLADFIFLAPSFGADNLSDNPDIMDYWGYTAVKLSYFQGKSMYTLMLRGNPVTEKGALEATYSYPIQEHSLFVFGKFFTGYGESLIDYNNYVTKFAFGISFSR